MPTSDPRLDPITGLLNRHSGLQTSHLLVTAALAGQQILCALWLNLDRFRQFNQSFGHSGGDQLIRTISERISTVINRRGEISRMGSDEFVCFLPNTDKTSAQQIAHDVLRAVEAPLHMGDILFRPSASIGIAHHSPEEDHLTFLERAERAMVQAKRQGGNCIVSSEEAPVPGRLGIPLAREELAIESDLHIALESGGLVLNYQPILGWDGRIEALEALMRCQVSGRNISPGKFIPVAEKTGLIVRMGEWSLLQGTRFAAQLHNQGMSTKVAINVSRLQLTSPKFLQAVHAALICANVPPELIELELTESLFMDISDVVQSNLRSVRSIGLGLAIDDFGTGYSCLSTIKDLPATKLKLDRAFICVLPTDRRAFAVVKAMTQLARELGMVVVAEGVETQGQLDAVQEAGVDAVQGFFHAVPMPQEAISSWLQNRIQQ